MLFVVQWTIPAENRNSAIERFKETGGPAPKGVKIKGRWHDTAQNYGFAVAEADDAGAIGRWCLDWSDLLELKVFPVLDDDGFSKLVGRR